MRTIKKKAEMNNLAGLISFIRDYAEENSMNSANIQKIELAVEEILVNIINYAYQDVKGDIEICCEGEGSGGVKITIYDDGNAFDSVSAEDPDVTKPIDEREIGGLGIFLVKQMMDDVKYKRENNRNILTLIKRN